MQARLARRPQLLYCDSTTLNQHVTIKTTTELDVCSSPLITSAGLFLKTFEVLLKLDWIVPSTLCERSQFCSMLE